MLKKYSIQLGRTDRYQYIIAFLLLLVYAGTLFFPLMDKDAGRHANVALKMHETGEWWKLVDRTINYLDKPHFLFWGSLISYKIFGVNTFAVRLPHIIYALVAIYSVYKLTKQLSDRSTAKLAALIMATAQAFVLAIMDARMETPLTAGIAFGLWHLIVFVDRQRLINIVLAALGLAIAFSTKGWVGPVIVFIATFFYILLNKKWKVLANPKTYLFIPFFALFISPVLYAYYQQFDRHPEIMVRGTTGHSGVKFILWDQNFERFEGDRFAQGEGGRNKDYFFLYHTFLWAFFPWSLAAYAGLFFWAKKLFKRESNSPFHFAAVSFPLVLILISFSKFKMPHYIIMLFPLATLMTAPYLKTVLENGKGLKFYSILHIVLAALVIPVCILLNYYFFRPANWFVQVVGPLLLIGLLLMTIKKWANRALKTVYLGAALSIVLNFYMYYNFFPNLMQYQAGNAMAAQMKREGINIPDSSIKLIDANAHTFDFGRAYNHQIINIDSFKTHHQQFRNNYLLLSDEFINQLKQDSFVIEPVITRPDYNVSTVDIKFLNPKCRASQLETLMLAKVYKP
jgi:4-amino-4-deoxy-L-arabinose transferase-like glycosyltransferase